MPFTPFTWMAFGVYHDKWISGIYHVDRKILIVVRGVVISDKSSDDIIGEGRGGQKQVFFFLKGAWTGRNSPSRSSWGVLVFILLLGFRNSFRQRRGLFTLFRIKFHHFSVSDRTITRCLGKFSFVFPSVSPTVISRFCTKLFGICTKQNIFCTKDGGNSCMFFQNLPYFFIQTADFLGAFPVFLSERVRFSRLPIRFLRVFSTLSVMILLFLFHQSVFFSVFFLIKNLFFQNEPSFRICIYSLFVWIFSYFFGCYGRFFCPDSHPFLHFFRPLAKNNLLFFIRIIRFLRFFRFVGIIFPAFFMWSWENFLSVSIIFLLSRNFFKRKICFFLFLSSGFQACLSWQSGYFSSFFRGETEKFFCPFRYF